MSKPHSASRFALEQWKPLSFLWLFILLTNRWFGWQAGVDYMLKQDVGEYSRIAAAAPGLITGERLGFHYGQRIFLPYLCGVLGHWTGLGFEFFYQVFTALLVALIFGFLVKILCTLRLTDRARLLILGLFALNPYSFRFYGIVPGMSQDLLFVAGTAIGFWALVERRRGWLISGCVLAILGRQTALLLVPGYALWILKDQTWAKSYEWKQRLSLCLGVCAVILGFYLGLGKIASHFCRPSDNADHITYLFEWLRSDRFTLRALGEFLLRLAMPLIMVKCILFFTLLCTRRLRIKLITPRAFACGITAFLFVAQPFLGGWEVTTATASRLSGLALLPMTILLGFALANEGGAWLERLKWGDLAFFWGLLLLHSFHHMYTWPLENGVVTYTLVQLSVMGLAGGVVYRASERRLVRVGT